MKGMNFKMWALCAILTGVLVAPAMGQQAKKALAGGKQTIEEAFKAQRVELIKSLNLPPDKEQAVLAVEDKYTGSRKDIVEGLMKDRTELEAALKAPTPDPEKIKGLVNALTSGQDALFNSFKNQRDEELALMTPVEQGKYLIGMVNLRQAMMEKKIPKGK
jgi:Spy/CpxP family protein refolding chaperone